MSNNQKYPKVPEITEGVRIRWHSGYHDGPLNGICMYNDAPHYFELKREYLGRALWRKVYRTYWIYRLLDSEWETIKYWHDEWVLHIGSHCDYTWDEDQQSMQRKIGAVNGAGHEYWKEMYYDRRKAFDEANGGSTEVKIDRPNQVVGYVTYDVLRGRPWKPWRRVRKKKESDRVRREKEGA